MNTKMQTTIVKNLLESSFVKDLHDSEIVMREDGSQDHAERHDQKRATMFVSPWQVAQSVDLAQNSNSGALNVTHNSMNNIPFRNA